ncbi:MAG: hypothetical protein HOI95_03460 [Chromatiales bacterium]|jgi:hypothetical protein|nr:hypothetical protein [Chromatiales bacterium]
MLSGFDDRRIVASKNVHDYFEHAIEGALDHQGMKAQADTIGYVAAMLTRYCRSEKLYEDSIAGERTPVLTFIYKAAIDAETSIERSQLMQRLGDVALFLSGVFADSCARKAVGVDYYISMGQSAYTYLAEKKCTSPSTLPNCSISSELADNFVSFVDILNEICERSAGRSNQDLVRLYEQWTHTGSIRAAQKLAALGIPLGGSAISKSWH